MSFWDKLIEERINEAANKGAFDNLPKAGQPLELEDDSHIPAELRLAHKILANAGYVPEEVELSRQINRMEDLLQAMPDEKTRYTAMQRLNYLKLKLASIRPTSPHLEEARYAAKIMDKFSKMHTGEKND
jgi:hypothetical protein